jgi:effector-binding domain-containing protein
MRPARFYRTGDGPEPAGDTAEDSIMMPTLPSLLPVLVLLALPSRACTLQDAASLLAAQRAGLGDAAALAKLGIVRSRGKAVFDGVSSAGTMTEILAPNGAARLEASFEGTPPSLRCTNRELYWMTGTGGVEIKKGWSAAADVRLFAIGRHRDWREVYASAELVGEAKVGDRACYELRLVPETPAALGIEAVQGEETPAPDTWWLDRDSKDLVRVAIYATVSGAGWQRLVIDYSDWKPVNGVRFPFTSRMSFGPADQPLVITLTRESVETDAKLEGDPFQPDEQVFLAYDHILRGGARNDPGFALQPRKEMQTATIRVKCKAADLQRELAIVLPEVMGYLQRQRLAPAGPPFARYHSFGEEIDLEAGMPVSVKITGNARVKPSTLPGGDVVSGMHVGPYVELPKTHEALARWLAEHEMKCAGGPWEVYWTDPGLERDPSKWRTEIFQPVQAGGKSAASTDAGDGGEASKPSGAASGADARDPELERLEIMVGTWRVDGGSGGPHGTVTFEWLDGRHFLLQHVDLVDGEKVMKGLEVIGRERKFGAQEASADITSRFYDNMGNTLEYVWEVSDGTLTIWGGERGSPASFHGAFSADGNTLTGGWKWPGGGYDSVSTRVLEGKQP